MSASFDRPQSRVILKDGPHGLAGTLRPKLDTAVFKRTTQSDVASDLKDGVYLPDPKNPDKFLKTYLLVFIDDHSRLVTPAEFYFSEKLPILEDCFRKAVLKRGLPEKVYVDNGKIFVSRWFRLACARLNVKHRVTAPYSPESKGKVERFMRTADQFTEEARLVRFKHFVS